MRIRRDGGERGGEERGRKRRRREEEEEAKEGTSGGGWTSVAGANATSRATCARQHRPVRAFSAKLVCCVKKK